jgi:23S rRNA pseudouridine2605 synthase
VGKTIGLPVVKIIRVRIGTLHLGGLKPREWRYLTADEVEELKGKPGKVKSRQEKTSPNPRTGGKHNRPRGKHERGRGR